MFVYPAQPPELCLEIGADGIAVLNLLLHLRGFASCWTVKRTSRSPFQAEERALIFSASTLLFA